MEKTFVEKSYNQMTESIQGLLDITSRVDERVKLMMQKQEILEAKIDKSIHYYNELKTKVSILESKELPEQLSENIDKLREDVRDMQLKMQTMDAHQDKSTHGLELRLQKLEDVVTRRENTWGKIVDNFFKVGFIILASYVLYKMGIQSPNLP